MVFEMVAGFGATDNPPRTTTCSAPRYTVMRRGAGGRRIEFRSVPPLALLRLRSSLEVWSKSREVQEERETSGCVALLWRAVPVCVWPASAPDLNPSPTPRHLPSLGPLSGSWASVILPAQRGPSQRTTIQGIHAPLLEFFPARVEMSWSFIRVTHASLKAGAW